MSEDVQYKRGCSVQIRHIFSNEQERAAQIRHIFSTSEDVQYKQVDLEFIIYIRKFTIVNILVKISIKKYKNNWQV